MPQKDKEGAGRFDFPLDPTPSLEAYNKFTRHIYEYLAMFNNKSNGLSIGQIMLGTPERPCFTAPIEMDPSEIEHLLRPTADILKKAREEAEKSIRWTRKIIGQTGAISPEADERIQVLEEFAEVIRKILHHCKGIAWHPECYNYVSHAIERFRQIPIPVQITILV